MAGKNSFRLSMRGRNINPKIYQNYELADAECDTKLPLFKFLTGLWCHADKEGRFAWSPRILQINIFPFHPQTDIVAMLDILVKQDVVRKYEVKGKQYGWLVRFRYYQYLAKKEPTSLFPPHPEDTPDDDPTVVGSESDDDPTVVGSESDSPENALVVDACRLMTETDGRCTKVDADARRLKTDHARDVPQSVQLQAKTSTPSTPSQTTQSQSSVQVSEEPVDPGVQVVRDYFKAHPEEMDPKKRPAETQGEKPATSVDVKRLWTDLGISERHGSANSQDLGLLCKDHSPQIIMETMRWAWSVSNYWFKRPAGQIVDFEGFRRAFPTMRKQYEEYREVIEHKDDPQWLAVRRISKELEEEERMFDRSRATMTTAAQEIPYR
jgi:hypothetical protein